MPTGLIDPSGLDFIAVADRPVNWSLGVYRHYSAELWECCGSVATGGSIVYTKEELKEVCGRLKIYPKGSNDAVDWRELLRRGNFKVWAGCDGVFYGRIWAIYAFGYWSSDRGLNFDGISVIFKSDTATKVVPVFQGAPATVKAKWKEIVKKADEYRYAEHWNEDTGVFKNWPASYYVSFQSNSNTFVRYILGSLMVEMPGDHPGNITPSINTNDDSEGDWVYSAAQVPFPASQPAPPQPTGPPPS